MATTPEQLAQMQKYFTPAQLTRAQAMCRAAVGGRVNVRLDSKTVVTGIVDSAEPAYVGFTGRSAYMVFSVDLLCGANQTRRNFKLSKLPA